MFCCLKGCLNGFNLTPSVPIRIKENPVQLDTLHMGHEVVVVKGGQRVCGSGCALGNAPLVQNKAYFEVKLQQGGVWAVGLATRDTDLNKVHGGVDKESWCLNSDGTVRHGNEELYHLSPAPRDSPTADLLVSTEPAPAPVPPAPRDDANPFAVMPVEGDTIGLAYDHVELNFFVNGKNMEIPVRNIRGTIYPALYVDDGAILDIILDNFLYPPPTGYEKIMVEQSLL
ncbi:SPRY domain-containing protein 7 [Leguminivora glycinivorella]|uniref:SPRY domain-containing protein 7 n=1 Tax=Leguminivora glycinivorella TaxID=1035111 RepID=UPI00201077F9|nr:SPRY domain-containing protein 7 [Leguminivora glycinivorella]